MLSDAILRRVFGGLKLNKQMLRSITLEQLQALPEYKAMSDELKAERMQWLDKELAVFPEEISVGDLIKWMNKLKKEVARAQVAAVEVKG